MLNQIGPTPTPFNGQRTAVDMWLDERQQLIVGYYQIAGLSLTKAPSLHSVSPAPEHLASFCELLMDYISAGHFEIFDMLVAGDATGDALRDHLYPKLLDSTDEALKFNDLFGAEQLATDSPLLVRKIADLGETLVERFEHEDQLIQHITAHHASTE
ncbi:Rsd/AlgQ family anti-sigma factor [Alteromonas oceanisediminis]|uniref:Rsd/AlgQ family anti-sigma factor n=1 Tax=Alteromonas oceanisediminis TaxID=2836180 RepID=UPI001BDAEF9F|nr:Rsd/AlgQ family anti-sigma factor [Alteromonas oceanisediminis]MBT0586926.1 Rsd/AlgQ family anti-sigma factor [Alteromonas oceanisediminis]